MAKAAAAAPPCHVVDFESERIEQRPVYPPKPVGVALRPHGGKAEYLAWGHPIGNNCTKAEAVRRLKALWLDAKRGGPALLFHNGKFDVDVAEVHLGMPRLPWACYHDTMFQAFMNNPDSRTLALKPLSEMELRMRSTERDTLRDWILANVAEAKRKPSQWGAHISKAPGVLVGRYAQGDVDRPLLLMQKFWPRLQRRGLIEAYDRERRIMLPLMDSERAGIRVNVRRLAVDLKATEAALLQVDAMIRRVLKAPGLDLDKNAQLANALDDAGKIEEWIMTKPSKTFPDGKRSTARGALLESLDDKRLLAMLFYRGTIAVCIRTFMQPWLTQARETGGWIHTQWNQVRQSGRDEAGAIGARTGRLSSTPNLQNVLNPSKIADVERRLKEMRIKLPPVPKLRSYIEPDSKDEVLLVRDFSQQEFRILAHFEDGALLAAYQANPSMDMHDWARGLVNGLLGTAFTRRPIKDIGFGLIYGMGVAKLAQKTDQDIETTTTLKRAYMKAIPGLKDLDRDLKARAKRGLPIKTWGGREYYCEPPAIVDGKVRTFEYKLINRLIQGSAADHTKEAIARYHEMSESKRAGGKFKLTVHDEKVCSVPRKHVKAAMAAMREAMESVKFDLPMLSDGKIGVKNWAELKEFDDGR